MKRTLWVAAAVLTAATGLFTGRPALAARAIQGTVGEVTAADAAALGAVGFRVWSALPGGETNINDNVSSCRNLRCIRNYVTNSNMSPGGYVGPAEATQAYNDDAQDSHFYMLVDASMGSGTANHIGFWGVAGVTANNSGIGSFLADACSGVTPTNCFERLDNTLAAPPLTNCYKGFGGGQGTIRAISGLNPIPCARIGSINGSTVALSWTDPPTYSAAMKPSNDAPAPPSPVKGVRLWKLERTGATCDEPTESDPGWTSVATFDLGTTSTQVQLNPSARCTFWAFTVRLIGPGGGAAEVQTGQQGPTHFVGVHSPAIFSPGFPCDDGNPCTYEHVDPFNGCQFFPAGDGEPCNDHCNAGVCHQQPGPPPVCVPTGPVVCPPPGNSCHAAGTCNPINGICEYPTANEGAPCDDGNPCTSGGVCANGQCSGSVIDHPGEVLGVRWAPGSKTDLLWNPVIGATAYPFYRGSQVNLPALLTPAIDSCYKGSPTSTSVGIPETPAAGTLLWYLVRAYDGTCTGSPGNATAGQRQHNPGGFCP
jgi:hypothetical protein